MVLYHPLVKAEDLPSIDAKNRDRLRKAIETRLMNEPQRYGTPLRKNLKGYWKLRVGDYRVVFKIVDEEVRILGIMHRKEVYEKIKKRV
ncbi:MAG: type II toxin-antitoxin system RelE/ParE family toxin [Deltaproteobacteria bacterium]|nr:type II toxin-antitoxin system RelE/ParE family toxin [Deltaproteobacteria bacterium]